MDSHTLDGCKAKVDWAEEQLGVLAREWNDWLKTQPYPSEVKAGGDAGWHCVHFDFSTSTPPRFAVIAGGIAHDLRSALDHIAWREAVECVGHKKADRNASAIAFPLAKNSADFRRSQTLKYVGKDARAFMERQQPYHGGHSNGPEALGLLHWFNRIDKHRSLHVTLVTPNAFQRPHTLIDWDHAARMIDRTWEIPIGATVEGKTKVACFRFAADGPDPHVRVKSTPNFTVGFGKVPDQFRGISIQNVMEQVRKVLADCADLIP